MSYYKENFKEIRRIGNGYFSTVFESYSKLDKKIYAIKKIPFKPEKNEETIKELKFLNKLKSEFVVEYTHSWIESNYYIGTTTTELDQRSLLFDPSLTLLLHIQMELCEMTLRDFIKSLTAKECAKNSITIDHYSVTCNIFEKLLNGLHYLHTHEPVIIHRDIKPENIMISVKNGEPFVKLADFGLSTFHYFVDQSHTKYVGTVQYRAPELSDKKYNIKADIYSLGIIVKELFNFDLNSEQVIADEKIINQYLYLKEFCVKCASVITLHRPTCDYILENKASWYYSTDEVDCQQENTSNQTLNTKMVRQSSRVTDLFEDLMRNTEISNNDKISFQNGRFKKEFNCDFNNNLIGDDGECSRVYKAKHKLDVQYYAIKIRQYTYSDETKTDLEKQEQNRFLRELQVNAKIRHNLLLQYKTYWFESDQSVAQLYIQMELCAMDLRKVVKLSDNITPSLMHLFVITNLFKEIAMGVNYLHSIKPQILHRDLKPANILLTFGEKGVFIKIADFNFAKFCVTDNNSSNINTSADYTAPEVRTGEYNVMADVFSLGMVLAKISNCLLKNYKPDSDRQLYESKLNKLKLLKSRMIEHTAHIRPTCEQILSDKSWILTEFEVKVNAKFKPFKALPDAVNEYDINETFFEFVTFEKLKHYVSVTTSQGFFSKIFGLQ